MHLLNAAFMALSALVAWTWPFELFLFAYAVLGPLHYLTEISWLQDHQWFGSSKHDWVVPTLAAAGGCVAYGLSGRERGLAAASIAAFGVTVNASWAQLMTIIAVAAGFGAAFAPSARRKTAYGAGLLTIGVVSVQSEAGRLLVSVFLVTLVHVLIFTSCFMLYGALKTRSAAGYASWALHLALPAAMLAMSWSSPVGMAVSRESIQRSAPVHHLLFAVCRVFGVAEDQQHATAAMRVVAYAYTYHYLNWFLKAETIRWHRVPPRRLAAILSLWLLAVALYAVDWNMAFGALLVLSIAHVYLEFPLNWRTMTGLATELNARLPAWVIRRSPVWPS